MDSSIVQIVPATDDLAETFEAIDTGEAPAVGPDIIHPLLHYVFGEEDGIYERLDVQTVELTDSGVKGEGSIVSVTYESKLVSTEEICNFTYEVRIGASRNGPLYDPVEVSVNRN